MPESLGRRLAQLRQAHGWTQQALAERLGLSRVALSHFEADLAVPSERTVILLAGIFRCEPAELVAATFYPAGKAMRLPTVAPRYTETELQLRLLERDLHWIAQVPQAAAQVCHEWRERLSALHAASHDERERQLLAQALRQLAS